MKLNKSNFIIKLTYIGSFCACTRVTSSHLYSRYVVAESLSHLDLSFFYMYIIFIPNSNTGTPKILMVNASSFVKS